MKRSKIKTHFFYVLNKVEYPEKIIEYDEYLIDSQLNFLKNKDTLGLIITSSAINDSMDFNESYLLPNGQDVRYFTRYGVKEISEEEGFNEIVEDDKRIVKRFNNKTIELLNKFGHRTDGWHFPFKVEAESKSHLIWKLKKMFPNYSEFILQ